MKRRKRQVVAYVGVWLFVCTITAGIGAAMGAHMDQGSAAAGALTGLLGPHAILAGLSSVAALAWLGGHVQRWVDRGD